MAAFYSDVNQQDPLVDEKLFDIESIYQSLDNIIFTQPNQRLFLPEFGVDLMQFLFEPMTDLNAFKLRNEIISAVHKWEPRVEVLRGLSYVQQERDSHEITVFIVFNIIGMTDTEYVYQTQLSKNQKGQYYAV